MFCQTRSLANCKGSEGSWREDFISYRGFGGGVVARTPTPRHPELRLANAMYKEFAGLSGLRRAAGLVHRRPAYEGFVLLDSVLGFIVCAF